MANHTRQSNIELLRILTICGVVVLHYNGNVAFDLVAPNSVNAYFLLFLEALFVCAVNLFVLISGYFLCQSQQRKAVKALELIVQVTVFGLGRYLLSMLLGNASFSLSALVGAAIPNNYFVTLYLAVYLLSPYINMVLRKLSDRQFGIMVGLCGLLFALWPTVLDMVFAITGHNFPGLYPTNTGGSQAGYSFLNFALMYLLGAYLHRIGPGRKGINALGAASCVGLLFLWQLFFPAIARAYCNPLVILLAVFLFRLFLSVQFQSSIINALAKGAFTCFLLHDFFLPHIGIPSVVNGSLPVLLGHITASVCVIFLLCWLVWRVYAWITDPIFRSLGKHLTKLNAALSPTEQEDML